MDENVELDKSDEVVDEDMEDELVEKELATIFENDMENENDRSMTPLPSFDMDVSTVPDDLTVHRDKRVEVSRPGTWPRTDSGYQDEDVVALAKEVQRSSLSKSFRAKKKLVGSRGRSKSKTIPLLGRKGVRHRSRAPSAWRGASTSVARSLTRRGKYSADAIIHTPSPIRFNSPHNNTSTVATPSVPSLLPLMEKHNNLNGVDANP